MQSIDSLWYKAKSKLSQDKLSDGEFHLVRIDENSFIPSFCGVDESYRLFIAFRTTNRPHIPVTKTAAFDSITSQRPDKSWLYVLRLLDNKLIGVFESLCIDLTNEVLQILNEEDFSTIIKRRVKSWQKLFANTDNGLLKKNEVVGLIGELTILIDLIKSQILPLTSAVVAWQGPYGSDQDFIFSNSAIETKTIRDDLVEIGIASLEQLNIDRVPIIYLAVVRYRNVAKGDPNSISLNAIASKALEICANEPNTLRELNAALLEAGYVYNEAYSEICIAIARKEVYEVKNDFPKIIPKDVSVGVLEARYSISLTSLNSFLIPTYPYGNY